MAQLDWGNLIKDAGSGGTFEPIPDGDYEFKVLDATAKTTSNDKTMFSIKAEVQSGAYAKRLVWDNLTISPENPNAMGFFFRKMAALGLTTEYFQTQPSNGAIETALKGRTFKGKVGLGKPYNGQTKNEIKSYAPLGGATGPSFTPGAPVPAPQPAAAAPAPAAAPPVPAAAPPAPVPPVQEAPVPVPSPWDNTPATSAVAPPPPTPF